MARAKTDAAPALTAAYAELIKQGKAVTVRALRDAAGVSTSKASEWLRDNRPAPDTPAAPVDDLRTAIDSLWAVAVAYARDENEVARAQTVERLRVGEAEALEEAEALRKQVRSLEADVKQSQAEAKRAERERSNLSKQFEQAQGEAMSERERARTAEARAERAEATAETLQGIVADHFRKED